MSDSELAKNAEVGAPPIGGNKQLTQIMGFRGAAGMSRPARPVFLARERADRWSKFMVEELLSEYSEAVRKDDIEGVLDALVDGMVFLLHCICDHGLQHAFEPAFDEVMRSNFTKFKDGKAEWDDSGKLTKGGTYTPPNLLPILCRSMGLTPMGVESQVLRRWMNAMAGLTIVSDSQYVVSTSDALAFLGYTQLERSLPLLVTMEHGHPHRLVGERIVRTMDFDEVDDNIVASDRKLLQTYISRR
jgi:hypothetical protein